MNETARLAIEFVKCGINKEERRCLSLGKQNWGKGHKHPGRDHSSRGKHDLKPIIEQH